MWTWLEVRKFIQEILDKWATANVNGMNVSELEALKRQYERLNADLVRYLRQESANYNVDGQLTESGSLQTQIQQLHKVNEEMNVDVDTAVARDELLRSHDTQTNAHSLYLADRPIRRAMVPYLWVLSVLFVGIGVLFFYWITPLILVPTNSYSTDSSFYSVSDTLIGLFTNRLTWMALFGASVIVIFFLSLKIAGVFGK
jgi:hypothetical protein